MGVHPGDASGALIYGKRKSGARCAGLSLAAGPPLSSSQYHKAKTMTFVSHIGTEAKMRARPAARVLPEMSALTSSPSETRFAALTRAMRATEPMRAYRASPL